jgi:MerR family transcriptional regulator, thiopeptide resistance regulator
MTVTNDTTNDSDTHNKMTDTTNDSSRTGIVPVLVYEDIEAGHDYLVQTFGFTSGGLHRTDDGTVVHGEVRMGESAVWLHRVTPEHEMASPRGATASHGGLSVFVGDVDAHYARSVAADARIDSEPTDQDYGLREYGARDPENHRFWFSTPLT